MIRTIRKYRISDRAGVLAAILIAAAFASAQVACLTHGHCNGAECFDRFEESHEDHGHGHDDHDGCREEAGPQCDAEHGDHDVHHHLHDGQTHPKRKFAAAEEFDFAYPEMGEVPAAPAAAWIPSPEEEPPLERYGLVFAERAPPLS